MIWVLLYYPEKTERLAVELRSCSIIGSRPIIIIIITKRERETDTERELEIYLMP